jgi:hypothetical protein
MTHQVVPSEAFEAISASLVFASVPKFAAQMQLRQEDVNLPAKAYTSGRTPGGAGKAFADSGEAQCGIYQLEGIT